MSFSDIAQFTGSHSGQQISDPFNTYSSMHAPDSMPDAMRWCERLMQVNGILRTAIERVVSYFVTDLVIDGVNTQDKKAWLDYLHNTLGILSIVRNAGVDYLTYGNTFHSVISPTRRYMRCGCGFERPLSQFKQDDIKFTDFAFRGYCVACSKNVRFERVDRRSTDESELAVKSYSPYEMEILWDLMSNRMRYIWKIPAYYADHIKRGHLFQLEGCPWKIVEAIKSNEHIRFDPDFIHHSKAESLAGHLTKGWGVPPILPLFSQAWYVQILHKFNEAIGMDYIVPVRIITPEPRSGSDKALGDVMVNYQGSSFTSKVNSILAQWRRDPASWFVSPFPMKYQLLGGEANQLAPYQLIEQGIDTLLVSAGVPADFFKGTLSLSAAPVGLRLMESYWSPLTYVMNRLIQWIVNKVSIALQWDEIKVRLARPTLTDDVNRQLAKLQMAMAGMISQSSALQPLDLDHEDELDKQMEEQKLMAKKTMEAQKEMEAMGLGDMMAAGAMGPGVGAMGPGAGAMGPGAGAMGAPGSGGPGMGAAAGGAPAASGGALGGAGMPQGVTQDASGQPVVQDPVEAIIANLPRPEEAIALPELYSMAESIAGQIWQLPESQKDSALRKLKTKNEALHALVKSKLDDMRESASTQGVAMAQQAARGMGQQNAQPQM